MTALETTADVAKLLQSPLEEQRLQGLRQLAPLVNSEKFPLLYQAMGDSSWRVRKEATELFLAQKDLGDHIPEIISLLHSQDNAGLRNAAVETLTRLGKKALPFLISELTCQDHDVRKFVLDILGEIGDSTSLKYMVQALSDVDSNVRAAAAENLGKIGAPDAVPPLLKNMETADLLFRFTILQALGQIGSHVPVQELLVFKNEPLLRKALFDCLGRVGGVEAVPELVRGLGDTMANVRQAAVMALEQISRMFPEDVSRYLADAKDLRVGEHLADQLENSQAKIRRASLRLLGLLKDVRFVDRILPLFASEELREEAAGVLIGMGKEASLALLPLWRQTEAYQKPYLAYVFGTTRCPESFPLLLEGLCSDDVALRSVCAHSLGHLGDEKAIPPLIERLRDSSQEVRASAMEALCLLGRQHPATILSALKALLSDEDPQQRMYAVNILGRIDRSESEAPILFALKDESAMVRQSAVKALGEIPGSKVLDNLRLALTDEDAEVRRLAIEILGGRRGEDILQPLQLALQDEDLWVRVAAVRAAGQLSGAQTANMLRVALKDPVGLVAIAALEALAAENISEAYPLLVEALGHPDGEVVNASLQILAASGRVDWLNEEAQSRLVKHPNYEVRMTVARILSDFEGEKCLPVLERQLADEDDDLVRALLHDVIQSLKAG